MAMKMRHYRDRNFHQHHSDESSLVNLIQRVCRREDDVDRRLLAAGQLRESIMKPDTRMFFMKNMEQILNSLIDVFFERSEVALQKDVARIISLIGNKCSNDPAPFFHWFLAQMQGIANDNVRNYLLNSFYSLLNMDTDDRKYAKVIVMMMDELQVILENIDSPEHLPVCIKPLILIAQNYPVAFRKHFRDTVDILVGWHIDHTQKMSLTLFASDALVKLHTHWLNDIQFSLTLLSQFLEDMEVFAEDNEKLVRLDQSVVVQHTHLAKIAALQRVFSTVVRSIGPVFNCSQKPITENFLLDALHRIINTSKQAGSYSRVVVRTADECARLLIGAITWRNEMVSDTLLEYAVFTVEKAADEAQLLHALDFVIVMVQEMGAALPDWFIKGLLLPDARLLKLKLSRNKVYCSELLALCQSCLTVKSVPLLQTAYLHIAGEFQEVINQLLLMHHAGDEEKYDKLTVIKDNPFAGKITVLTDGVKSSRKGANLGVVKGRHEAALLKTALFNIVSLLELADAKSSLIGMYAVSPNIFELFHNALLVTRKRLASIYPSLQYAILQALYSHCQRRKNFTRSYIGEVNNSMNDPVDDATRATQRHYPAILELLSSFLLDKSVSFDCRKLLLHWGREILERLKSIKDTKLLEAPGFSNLIYAIAVAGLQNVPTHSLQSAKCLLVTQQLLSVVSSTTFGSENLTKQHLQQASFTTLYDLITKCCFTQLWNVNNSVRNAFAGNQSDACLLNSIPVDKIFSVMNESLTSGAPVISSKKPSNQRQLILYGLQKSWYAKRIVNSSADSRCMFHAHHFKDLIDRIIKPNVGGNTFSSEWLEQLYWSCQRHVPNQQYNGGSGTLHTSDESFLYWWALWKAAEYTIANKLRTPLGKPQDTLTRVEGAIRDYERKLLASHPSGPVHTTNFRHGKLPRMAVYASWSSLQHPHLMLQFFGNLEKLLYNACEGSAVSIPPQAKTIKTFFYTNRLTCEQWLNRLRLPLMRIGLNCGLPAVTFQNGEAVLQDMAMRNNTSGFEFESAVAMLVEALVELKSPHAIEGVYRWCRNLVGQNKKQHWAWIRGAKMLASGSYEDALREFQAPLAAALRKHSNSGGANSEGGDASKVNDSSNSLPGGANVNVKKTFSPARSFVIQQTIKCYTNLNRFKDAQEWLDSVPKDDYQTSYLNNTHYLEALNNFGIGEFKATSESCHKLIVGGISTASSVGASGVGGKLNGGHLPCYEMGGFSRPWNWIDLQCACELQTINYATKLKLGEHESLANAHLQQVIESSLGCIKLQSSHKPASIPCGFQTIYSLASSVKKATNQEQKYLNLPISSNIEEGSWLNTSAANLLMSSMDHLIDESCAKAKKSRSSLRMAMIKANRRNGNYNRAYRLLCDEFAGHDVRPKLDDDDVSQLVNVCTQLVPEKHAFKLGPLHLQCESAKLMYATGKCTDGIILLADSLSTYLDNAGKSKSEVCCRGLLHLASYMLTEWRTVGPQISDLLEPSSAQDSGFLSKLKIIMEIEKKSPHMSFANNEDLTAEVGQEIILGSLFNLATLQAPDLAKSWFAMAGWCYKWGRKTNDAANSMGYVELLEEERQEVQAILQPLTSKEEYIEEVYSVLKQSHCCTVVTQADGDALDENSTQQQNGSGGFAVMDQKTAAAISSLKNSSSLSFKNVNEAVLEQFTSRCGPWLSHAPNHITQSLIAVRHRVCARIFNQLQLAAEAYFKFLRLNACQQVLKYEDGNVTATLRLLRLLVKHALELQSTLEEGFATTPTDPWKGIIPQLFSRLNHPELNVRRSITNLLSRMATQSPHLIIYPVVVATTRLDPRKHSAALRTSLDEHEVDDFEDSPENSLVKDLTKVEGNDGESVTGHCYSQVLQSLIQQDEKKVCDVQLLVLELRRITLLWDELWLGTLNQHQQDIMKRLQQLHDEAKRVNNNAGLSKMEKQSILQKQREAIMRPVVYAMKRVYQITCADPETPHEQWFAESVQPLVESALEKLVNPPNPNNPRSCWSGFKQLHSFLETRSTKRTSQALNLDDISPKLMALKSTTVPIPGVTDSSNGLSIEGFSHVVTILPTKTKPKKLQFVGSDGRRYNYLFKGLEDLHLDERIMQFLSIANHLLRRQHGKRGYVARHYAVTPLGPRSGLIQWVTNATPLFALYKRWQQRQATIQANKAQQQGNNNIPNIQVLRPSDLFYNKLHAAVKKAGVDVDRMSRRDWPKNILRSVFDELSAETPGDLLHREIWCASTSADELWSMQQKYTQSTAVMSMIGYVLGLGDRHLDNVLIDLESGEVVHIDYNVCFEKGLQLRVPERVPFRLTKNLVQAFGVAGVQGVFRNSCEQVMQTLRKGRETLLTLLEAFIYDPLVDWTGTVEGGYAGAVYGGGGQQQASKQHKDADKLSKKEMDREITRSLFSSRVAEMKQGWYNNRDEMMKTLPMLIGELTNYQNHFSSNMKLHEKIQSLLEVKSHVKEALSNPRHPYRTLPQRWVQYQQQQTKKTTVLGNLQDKRITCDKCCERYTRLLAVLSSHQLKALECERSTKIELGPCPFRQAFKFLQSAGQANSVSQANSNEKELMALCEDRRVSMKSCLDALNTYAGIAAHFPPRAAIGQHREAIWSARLTCVSNFILENDYEKLASEVDTWRSKEFLAAQARAASSTDTSLKKEVESLNNELIKLIKRRENEDLSGPEAEIMLTKHRKEIFTFVQATGNEGWVAFTYALSQTISSLNEQAIKMEKHVSNAGHRLVDQTSQEGDWFLEELSGLFANASELLQVNGRICEDIKLRETTKSVTCVEHVFRSLLELYNNFRNIIVPETSKLLLQSEEASAIKLVSDLNGLVQGVRPDDLMKQLTNCLRLRGHQNGSKQISLEAVLKEVEILQIKYRLLVNESENANPKTGGDMLLQAFDGLFNAVWKSFQDLLVTRREFHNSNDVTTQGWAAADVLQEASGLQKLKHLSDNLRLVQALMFVKQIQAMHTFFALAQHNAKFICVKRVPYSDEITGHQIVPNKQFYPEERLCKPIKFFVAFFVQELLIGLPTESLAYTTCAYLEILGVNIERYALLQGGGKVNTEKACKVALDKYHSTQVGNVQVLGEASMLLYNFNHHWKAFDRIKRLGANYDSTEASLTRAQLQVTRFQWLHEDLLDNNAMIVGAPRRSTMINDLNKRINSLANRDRSISQLKGKMKEQHDAIQQRLRWAAGANPTLQTVLKTVDSEVGKRELFLRSEENLSRSIMQMCEDALAFERNRLLGSGGKENHSRDVSTDDDYMRLVSQAQNLCMTSSATTVKVNDLERTIVDVWSPKPGANTEDWLRKVTEKISSSVAQHKVQRQQEEMKMSALKNSVRDNVPVVKQLLHNHSRLLSDVKTLLKTMIREEEGAEGNSSKSSSLVNGDDGDNESTNNGNGQVGSVRRYRDSYKEVTSLLHDTLNEILQKCDIAATPLYPEPLINSLKAILGQMCGLYDGLVAFAAPNFDLSNDSNHATFASALRSGNSNNRSSPASFKRNGPSVLHSHASNNGLDLLCGVDRISIEDSSSNGGGGVASSETNGGSAALLTKMTPGVVTSGVTQTPRKKPRDPKTGKAIQERNNTALSVWRKVKLKLDGKDIETGKRTQVTEQVEQIVSEAMDPDNLSLLYEGWTAWV